MFDIIFCLSVHLTLSSPNDFIIIISWIIYVVHGLFNPRASQQQRRGENRGKAGQKNSIIAENAIESCSLQGNTFNIILVKNIKINMVTQKSIKNSCAKKREDPVLYRNNLDTVFILFNKFWERYFN